MRKVCTLTVLGLVLTGCIGGRLFPRLVPPHHEGDSLRLDGYYYTRIPYAVPEDSTGPSIFPLLLWRDGTAANFHGIRPASAGDMADTPSDSHEAFELLLRNPRRFTPGRRGSAEWGAFRVRGDSIVVRIMRAVALDVPRVREYRGVVLSDTSFTLSPGAFWLQPDWTELTHTYYFHPLAQKPDSTNWTWRLRK